MFYNGIQSDTSIVVIARSDSDGNCILTLNTGESVTVAAAVATNYGHVRLSVTGLSPDTRYTYTVTIPDGSGGNGEITTFKSSGSEKLAFFSCEEGNGFAYGPVIANSGVKAAICLGDESYNENPTFPDTATALVLGNHHSFHKEMREKTDKMYMAQRIGFGGVTDDHDTFLNNVWDDQADPPVALNALLSAVGRPAVTAAEWDTILGHCGESIYDFQLCNPSNNTVTSDTDPLYFSFECGNMLVIVPALLMWTKTEMRGNPNGTVPLMGANQLAWFKAELEDTTKPFKIILSQKTTSVATNDNNDSWNNYSDMDTVLQWIHDNSSGFTVPGGVIFGTGDWHSPGVGAFENGVSGSTYDHVIVNPCPAGRVDDIRDPGAWLATTRDAVRPGEINDNRLLCYGYIESTNDYVEINIKVKDGSIWARGRVNAGENKLSRQSVSVAI